ncbi:PRC and DUF2382 domain-containing protein [Nocardiopsis sp. CT-R113]|jgi:uncharacterized protein (TIGR02271 family)|uniref:PRC and DUF2382 domain-containing protein n=1 Tax=Nocardiopsis codii TaxID=3065942 RepID=A0ABU7K8M4_9ACTN|nr:PRC and DUF2382 domain-containing protein [Nocardiopsis sp. CT-R113]MEE2037917.1 PRC and DUF2382 domain-containing protein [Nocardiopsis sp. CT-R113]
MARDRAPGDFIGHHVLDEEGHSVGKIKQVYLDDETNEPSWVSVETGLFGRNETLVPLQGSQPKEEDIQVPFDKATVKDAPNVDADRHISPEEERLVRDYYARHGSVDASGRHEHGTAEPGSAGEASEGVGTGGRSAMDGTAGTAAAAGTAGMAGTSGDTEMAGTGADADMGGMPDPDDVSMIRSEERVDIGVERHEAGHARLHKYVETEQFDEAVPLHHDELQMERRPVTDASGVDETGDMREEEETFTLYEERPVVSKERVPVEEVHVRKRDVTREEHVQGERRRERIELEDDDGEPSGS